MLLYVLTSCFVANTYVQFPIICSLQYNININTVEVDPHSDLLHICIVKPNNTKRYKICKLHRVIFHILQHFTTKLCNFTKFRMLFNAVVMNFTIAKCFKILSIMQSVYCIRSISENVSQNVLNFAN